MGPNRQSSLRASLVLTVSVLVSSGCDIATMCYGDMATRYGPGPDVQRAWKDRVATSQAASEACMTERGLPYPEGHVTVIVADENDEFRTCMRRYGLTRADDRVYLWK